MIRDAGKLVHFFILALVVPTLLAGCGAAPTNGTVLQPAASSTAAQSSTAQTVLASATARPTPIARTNNPKDLILSTTTSTQDSGLLDVLIPQFEQQTGYHVKTVAVGSGAAIGLGQRGEADVVLAHAPENERQFVAAGTGVDRQLVMFNDFILVGPADDPAKVHGTSDITAALKAIAASKTTFISRGDKSGTDQIEKKLWKDAAVKPQGQAWYVESGSGMGQTLQIADQRHAYTISDRATYLAFKARVALALDVEKDPQLLNVYHVIAVNPQRFPQVNKDGAQLFLKFLLAPPTQQLIGSFGKEKYGQQLFTPCAQNNCHLPNPDG
ncbi:MAG: substrate-binding domain-containing protein [Herpetosiphonaceae bacterium]|nr:substrate-binding domain-containing protein [Herpetosiphonaceae bacterium]